MSRRVYDSPLANTPDVDTMHALQTFARPALLAAVAALIGGFASLARADDDAALAAASKESGASVTASGLVYRSIKEGTGASPGATDTVKVNYRGTFVDGKEFDSSAKNGGPISFPLNR